MAASGARPPSKAYAATQRRAWPFMLLLSLQYGVQPILSKRYSGKEVIMTSSVLSCEFLKVVCAIAFMAWEGNVWVHFKSWSLKDAAIASICPAAIYALQNTLLQLSYRHLDSLTFSLLNQTKLMFTALFMFSILGQRQSKQQVGALCMLLLAAALLSVGQSSTKGVSDLHHGQIVSLGIIPVLVASVLSGLASTLCQWASQVQRRSTYLMTIEMSTIGSLCLLVSMLKSPDGEAIISRGFFSGWTILTLLPLFTNAVGGILVGLVTTYAGGVRKGFVIVSALIVTALLQYFVDGIPPSSFVLMAMPLVIMSTIIYQRYPYTPKSKKS